MTDNITYIHAPNTAEDGVRALIKAIGEDVHREGLLDTPKRVVKAYKELTEGYNVDIKQLLSVTFDVGDLDDMVIVKDIKFVS